VFKRASVVVQGTNQARNTLSGRGVTASRVIIGVWLGPTLEFSVQSLL